MHIQSMNDSTVISHEATPASTKQPEYERWNLLDEGSIDYGRFGSKVVNEFSNHGGFYITTAINYTNGPAHMGHAYEATTTDAIARYFRVRNGEETVFFLTGADEHGQKIANTADLEGKVPIDICDKVCTCADISIFFHGLSLFITLSYFDDHLSMSEAFRCLTSVC